MKIAISLAVVMMVLVTSTAWAVPTININDLGDGGPIVSSSGFIFNSIFNPIVTTGYENARIDGIILSAPHFPITFDLFGQNAKFYGVRLLEPNGDVGAFAILRAREPFFIFQEIDLTFVSDGATDIDLVLPGGFLSSASGNYDTFALALAAYNSSIGFGITEPKAPFLEDGTLQNLFNFPWLVVNAQLDLPSSPVLAAASALTAAPIPGSLPLLATGILSLIAFRKRLV